MWKIPSPDDRLCRRPRLPCPVPGQHRHPVGVFALQLGGEEPVSQVLQEGPAGWLGVLPEAAAADVKPGQWT